MWLFGDGRTYDDLVCYRYLHSETPDLTLSIYVDENENDMIYVVGFVVDPTLMDAECEEFVGVTKAVDPQFDDPNASEYVREHIEPAAARVRAYLERFPHPPEKTPETCGICGDALIKRRLWGTINSAEERGEAHYKHFREHHLGNSTVKSALKRA